MHAFSFLRFLKGIIATQTEHSICGNCATEIDFTEEDIKAGRTCCPTCGGNLKLPPAKKINTFEINDIPTKWLTFCVYIRLPLGAFVNLAYLNRIPDKNILPALGADIFIFAFSLLLFATMFGLGMRRMWGWKLNWWVIGIETISRSLSSITAEMEAPYAIGHVLGGLIFMGLVWVWPNYVYFKKRKSLFSSASVETLPWEPRKLLLPIFKTLDTGLWLAGCALYLFVGGAITAFSLWFFHWVIHFFR